MIKARINGENIVLSTDLEEWRNEGISEISDGMLYLVRKYEEIANKNTEESEIIGRRYILAENKMQDTANERTLRYIAEKVLNTKDYVIERIESPDVTEEEKFQISTLAY